MTQPVLNVIRMGNPLLRQSCEVVEDPLSPVVQEIISQMEATVEALQCTGLAAPQVAIPLRIVLFRIPAVKTHPIYKMTPEYDPDGVPWTLMINPHIIPLSDEINIGWEACLSLPGLVGRVPRYHAVEYRFLDRQGVLQTRIAKGFHATVVQHECDHLDGILYPDRMLSMADFGFREEVMATLAMAL